MEERKKESWLWGMEQEKAKAVKKHPNPQPAA
jgi:hypothetical protein